MPSRPPHRSPHRRPVCAVTTAALAVAATVVAGCTDAAPAPADPNRVDVVAAFYPLQFVSERVGGDAVRVTSLVEPGVEPHDLELNPAQVALVAQAELVLYLKGFQPVVDEAVAQEADGRALDVATTVPLLTAEDADHDHAGEPVAAAEPEGSRETRDPHVWLDPTRLATIADRVADRLAQVDPDRAAAYRAGAAKLRTELEALDREFAAGLRGCARREVITSHTAFGYLTQRYGLEQIGISGLSPEDEPPPQRLRQVIAEAREHKATTIFFETLVSPRVAELIAQEVGARTAVLDPLEGLEPGSSDDYFAVMRRNLGTLRTALGCP
ncbi:MAG TPA: metal ABC transporter substrate-binding protein [Pilimelia sp.]|nr:metal ABC transporter substrate-binding protein [Pilimelia sp.]